ncbi:methyltransferase domain-containing protein [Amycolatopsis sp. NPDC059090]|uniref:methyltransferase domain-containing protein n=1 Tax=Amycolatopsis sp. NPDC059090 TaxID=3346723 RepID=UPI00366D07D6
MFELDSLDARLRSALVCPACRGKLGGSGVGLDCRTCGREYATGQGYPDFAPEISMKPGLGPFYLQDPLHVPKYEEVTRAAFLQIMGDNWDGAVAPGDEDDYLRQHLDVTEAPLLDLACGAGRWTRTLADYLGSAQVVGLDLSTAMLATIQQALPEVPVVRASALQLPFADRSLGAVNCSNALQLLPDPRAVLQEVGRCLRPGGRFTALTFLRARRPAYRYFQERHERTFNVRAFDAAELVAWLDSAGLETLDVTTAKSMVLLTAGRRRV